MSLRDTYYSLIVPLYKNEESISELLDAVEVLNGMLRGRLEAVIVVDGSPDRSYEVLKCALPARPFRSKLMRHSRNFGSFAAIRTGLTAATGPYFATMAADLQEPRELAAEFFAALERDECDVALGVRTEREDPWFSRIASAMFWRMYRKWIQPEMPPGGFDAFGCNTMVRDALVRTTEANSTLVGLLIWIGFRRKLVPYKRLARRHGTSAWSIRRKLVYMFDSAYAFSAIPVTLLLGTGLAGVAGSTVISAIEFTQWYFGDTEVKGYTPLILAISFSTSLILFGLGVVGGYVWRTFENTKGRPQSLLYTNEVFEGKIR